MPQAPPDPVGASAEALATRKMLEGMGADYEAELEELKASVIE